jgi:CHASE3 domain sensor protein
VRKTSIFGFAVVGIALLVATGIFYSKYKKYESDYVRMTVEEEQTLRAGEEIAAIMIA